MLLFELLKPHFKKVSISKFSKGLLPDLIYKLSLLVIKILGIVPIAHFSLHTKWLSRKLIAL